MKAGKLYLILFFLLLLQQLSAQKTERCGNGRWDVKILADKKANEINFNPAAVKYKDLKKFDKSVKLSKKKGDENRERMDDEKQVYRITGIIKEWSEHNDHDYHLIVMLSRNHSIVCEIPSPDSCPEVKSTKFAEQYRKCRNTVLSLTYRDGKKSDEKKSHKLKPKVKVEIEGVLFHDLKHKNNVKGAMPHNLELHPVLNIRVVD